MCGRFSLAADSARIAKRFGLKIQEDITIKPRYNFAPSEETPSIVFETGEKRLQVMKWGITRQWDKAKPPLFIINLKAEKLVAGPFKSLLTKRRCLVPADGFYEWKADVKPKQPFRFTLKDDSLFVFPAIYDEVSSYKLQASSKNVPSNLSLGTSNFRTFCIFTTPANPLVAPVHHRMPAILPPDLEAAWLAPDLTDVQKIVALLKPYPETAMKCWAVSPVLNSAKIDAPELIRPLT